MGKYSDNVFNPGLVRLRELSRHHAPGDVVWVDPSLIETSGRLHGRGVVVNGVTFYPIEVLPPVVVKVNP